MRLHFEADLPYQQAAIEAAAKANTAAQGGASAVVQAYHGGLVPPFCTAAARGFFPFGLGRGGLAGFGRCPGSRRNRFGRRRDGWRAGDRRGGHHGHGSGMGESGGGWRRSRLRRFGDG